MNSLKAPFCRHLKRVIPALCLVTASVFLFFILRSLLSDGTSANYIIGIKGDPPNFSLYDGRERALVITRLVVMDRNPKTSSQEELWSIEPTTLELKVCTIGHLDYGKVPTGWIEKAPAKPIYMGAPKQLIVNTRTNRFWLDIQGRDDWKTHGEVYRN